MAEYQLGAGVLQRTTVGGLWQAMSGRPLSADLLDWPPDLFALTSLVLQRSGAFRFALSPPPGRLWGSKTRRRLPTWEFASSDGRAAGSIAGL